VLELLRRELLEEGGDLLAAARLVLRDETAAVGTDAENRRATVSSGTRAVEETEALELVDVLRGGGSADAEEACWRRSRETSFNRRSWESVSE
jgi:hypothetical protein